MDFGFTVILNEFQSRIGITPLQRFFIPHIQNKFYDLCRQTAVRLPIAKSA